MLEKKSTYFVFIASPMKQAKGCADRRQQRRLGGCQKYTMLGPILYLPTRGLRMGVLRIQGVLVHTEV